MWKLRETHTHTHTHTHVEKDVKKGESRVGHTPAFLESSLSGRAAVVVTDGGHEISEEKHVSKSESIATMPWRRECERGLALLWKRGFRIRRRVA